MVFRISCKALALATSLTLCVTATVSARTIFDCTLEEISNNRGWVPLQVIVSLDPGVPEVTVVDPMIQDAHGGPIEVMPTKDTDGVLSASWKLTLEATNGNTVPLRYDFTIYKTDKKAKVRATPLGYDNNWVAWGTCKVKEQ